MPAGPRPRTLRRSLRASSAARSLDSFEVTPAGHDRACQVRILRSDGRARFVARGVATGRAPAPAVTERCAVRDERGNAGPGSRGPRASGAPHQLRRCPGRDLDDVLEHRGPAQHAAQSEAGAWAQQRLAGAGTVEMCQVPVERECAPHRWRAARGPRSRARHGRSPGERRRVEFARCAGGAPTGRPAPRRARGRAGGPRTIGTGTARHGPATGPWRAGRNGRVS
jgi:hypothetical protein